MNPPVSNYKNRILSTLPNAEISRLAPHLSRVTLKQEQTLSNGNPQYAYFLEQGIASVVATVEDGTTVEIGVIGLDGVVGISGLLGAASSPARTFVQIAGSGLRIESGLLKEEFERPGELRKNLQKYIQAYLVQPHRQPSVTDCITLKRDSRDGC